ncbi:MAG: DUF1802 family protein [Microcystaceae cyanobacterium]
MIMLSVTTHALKEWAVAVDALESGQTILLLRKGGIREVGRHFQVQYQQVLLYPTYEHQKPHLLKPDYRKQVTPVTSGWHPKTVRIGCWAEITHIFSVSDASVVEQLFPYHIWNEQFISERLHWKPHQPLYLLLLRTYRLPEPLTIPYCQEYGGCKSWIDLLEPIALQESISVFDEHEYTQQVKTICSIVDQSQVHLRKNSSSG